MSSLSNERIRVIIISDGTGETAKAMARAAMTQFKQKDAVFTRFKSVSSEEQIDTIFREASLHHDIILYTIVTINLREHIKKIAKTSHVRSVDLMGPILEAFSNVFEKEPTYTPGLLHAVNDDYFQRISAIEFTLNHDDGRNLETLQAADVVLLGISRTSKTPLSLFLSLEGFKVVNVPIILNVEVPQVVFQIDQRKIFGLTIDPEPLLEIRKNRLERLGGSHPHGGDYANRARVMEELEWANALFRENKRWPIFNVTSKAVEETAAEIMKVIQMRKSNRFKQQKP